MRSIVKPRQTGKTVECIYRSAETGYPIIVRNRMDARSINKEAKKFGLEIPDPITIRDAMNTKILQSSKVIVDDADFVFDYMMKEVCGANIDTLSMVRRNKNGSESIAKR